MSKSDNSDYSRINLTDSPDDIRRKIQKAKTDAIKGISFDPEIRPEISNLIKIYALNQYQKYYLYLLHQNKNQHKCNFFDLHKLPK